MYIRKEPYSTTEKLYLFIWTFYSLASFLLGSSYLPYEYDIVGLTTYALYITFGCQLMLLLSFFLGRYSLKRIIIYLFFLGITMLVGLTNTSGSFLVGMLFIVLAQNIDIDKLIRYDIKLKIIILFIILFMVATGIIRNYSSLFYGTTVKHAFGFGHPNTFTVYVFTILVEWLCIRYGKMKWYEWVCVGLLAVLPAEVGGGRSSTYTFVVIYLLYLLATIVPKLFYSKISKIAFFIVTPLMAGLSFWAAKLYDQGSAIAIVLNSVLTGRIHLGALFLRTYEIKPFGQEIIFGSRLVTLRQGVSMPVLDNAYIRCVLNWGSIMFILLIVAFCLLFMSFLKNQRIDLALFLLFFVVFGLGEWTMFNVLYNLPFLCILGYGNHQKVAETRASRICFYAQNKLRREA